MVKRLRPIRFSRNYLSLHIPLRRIIKTPDVTEDKTQIVIPRNRREEVLPKDHDGWEDTGALQKPEEGQGNGFTD